MDRLDTDTLCPHLPYLEALHTTAAHLALALALALAALVLVITILVLVSTIIIVLSSVVPRMGGSQGKCQRD